MIFVQQIILMRKKTSGIFNICHKPINLTDVAKFLSKNLKKSTDKNFQDIHI